MEVNVEKKDEIVKIKGKNMKRILKDCSGYASPG